jgi:hypothetical protein
MRLGVAIPMRPGAGVCKIRSGTQLCARPGERVVLGDKCSGSREYLDDPSLDAPEARVSEPDGARRRHTLPDGGQQAAQDGSGGGSRIQKR